MTIACSVYRNVLIYIANVLMHMAMLHNTDVSIADLVLVE